MPSFLLSRAVSSHAIASRLLRVSNPVAYDLSQLGDRGGKGREGRVLLVDLAAYQPENQHGGCDAYPLRDKPLSEIQHARSGCHSQVAGGL